MCVWMKNIGDLSKFIRFIKLCAGRIGQLLNLSSLANECGVAVSTYLDLDFRIGGKLHLIT